MSGTPKEAKKRPWWQVSTRTHPTPAKVSKDSGNYKDRTAIHDFVSQLHTLSMRRRLVRLTVLGVLMGGVIVGVIFASLPWHTITTSASYDPAIGLTLDLSGCDARLVPGTEASMHFEARRDITTVEWVRGSGGAITGVRAHNSVHSCADAPLGVCASWCRLTVNVPPAASDAADFIVTQPAGDASHPSVTVGRVAIKSLATSPAGSPLPSLSFYLLSSTVASGVSLNLHEGSVLARNASLAGDVRVSISGGGSVRLHDVPASATPASVRFAQPSGHACIATDEPGALVVAANPERASCIPTNDDAALRSALSLQYDSDGDALISRAEFKSVADALACCGPRAPIECSCEAEAEQMYGTGSGASATSSGGYTLGVAAFADRLLSLSMIGLAPPRHVSVGSSDKIGCLERLDVYPSADDAGSGFVAANDPLPEDDLGYLELSALFGEVSVTLRQASPPPGEAARMPPPPPPAHPGSVAPIASSWAQCHAATGTRVQRGPKIVLPDAARLASRYAGIGSLTSSRELYLVIDVVSTVGRPWSRWVYTTSDMYLTIDPAHVTFLSGSALSPNVRTERVRIINDDCNLLAPPGTPSAREWTQIAEAVDVATYEQLRRSLLGATEGFSSGSELRGSLVLLDQYEDSSYAYGWLIGAPRYIGFEARAHGVAGDRLRVPWRESSAHTHSTNLVFSAASLAALAGATIGLAVLCALYGWLRRLQHDTRVSSAATARAVLSRHSIPEDDIRAWLSRDDATHCVLSKELRTISPSLGALETADGVITTLSAIFATPLRQVLISSAHRFAQERLQEAQPPRIAAPKGSDGKGSGKGGDDKGSDAKGGGKGSDGKGGGKGGDGKKGGKVVESKGLDAAAVRVHQAPRAIDMRELMHKYELFCVAHGFAIDDDKNLLHDYLSARHVIIAQSFVRRIIGLKWRNPRSPLEPKKASREDDMPVELHWSTLWPRGEDRSAKALEDKAAKPKKTADEEENGSEHVQHVSVQHGGKCGYSRVPLPVHPLASIDNQPYATQYAQQLATDQPPLQRPAPRSGPSGTRTCSPGSCAGPSRWCRCACAPPSRRTCCTATSRPCGGLFLRKTAVLAPKFLLY